MATIVTVNPPNTISVTAVNENEYNISLTTPSQIDVTVSPVGIPGPAGPPGPLPEDYEYVHQSTLDTNSTGLVEGGEITITGATIFSIAAGRGQIANGLNLSVSWDQMDNVSTLYNGINCIRITSLGILSINQDVTDHDSKIELGTIFTGGNNTYILELAEMPRRVNNLASRLLDFTSSGIRALVSSGLEVTEQADPNFLKLNISSGTIFFDMDTKILSATSVFNKVYLTSDYGWVPSYNTLNTIEPGIINDITKPYGQALVSMTDSYWKKDLLVRTPSGNVYYFYGQSQYPTKTLAINAPLPITPADISTIVVYLAVIICKKEDTTITTGIKDIRPIFSRLFLEISQDEAFVPAGGTSGQLLSKIDSTDFNTQWKDDKPVGLDTEVLFNDNGAWGHDTNFLYNKTLKALSVGKPTILPNASIAAGGDVDGYVQVTVQNDNDGIDASSDFVATADNGDDATHYIDLGINNSMYADPDFSITSANDGYLFVQDGDLVIGSTKDQIKLFIGDTTSESVIGTITSSGLDISNGNKISEDGIILSDMIKECNNATAETAAFAAGSKIVIRTDLL